MNKLGLMDQLFYKVDKNGLFPMLMCGAMIVDPADSPYPMNGKLLAEHLAARMQKIPLLRKKLVQDSLKIGHIRLVDDPDFDVSNHITRTRLKAPGGYKQLMDCLGEFSSQRLDLTRPLWHYNIIEGLQGGRFAVALHLHHSILDGIGAMEALSGMWDSQPVKPERPTRKPWPIAAAPTSLMLLRDALLENADRLYVKAPAFLLNNMSPLSKLLLKKISISLRGKEAAGQGRRKGQRVCWTSLNDGRISERRVISYVEFPLAEIKALARRLACSINDLALLINSFALQHYFDGIGEKIDFDLVAGMPLNIRTKKDGSSGNAVSIARVNLHNQISETLPRLQAIVRDTTAIKTPLKATREGKSTVSSKALLGLVSPILLDALILAVVKLNLTEKVSPLVNVAITNVPGSPEPKYIAGARLVSAVPMAPAADTVGLTITISSTDTHLAIGFHGCGRMIKDKELLVAGARRGFEALQVAARGLAKTGPGKTSLKSASPRATAAAKTPARKNPVSARRPVAKVASRVRA